MSKNAPQSLKLIKQKLDLLRLNPDFQEAILGLRKKWKILKHGFVNNQQRITPFCV